MDCGKFEDIHTIEELYSVIKTHEEWVNQSCINLYPATNITSSQVRNLLSSSIGSRVGEGKVGDKFQTATKYLERIECTAYNLLRELFHAQFCEYRVLSASMANAVVFNALLNPGDTIMALSIPAGGHISHNKVGVAGYHRLKIVNFDFDSDLMNIDLEKFREKVGEIAPQMVILGASLILFPEPVREIKQIIDEHGLDTWILYDISHVSGLVAGNQYPNPLDEGADIITSSTYKTFPGPPGGMILCNDEEVYKKIARATFPGMTANFHYNRVAALVAACMEFRNSGDEYARQILANSKTLAMSLDSRGFKVLGKKCGFTATHQVVVDVSDILDGHSAALLLEAANIICNKELLPTDSLKKAKNPSGLRLGVQEVTRLGMGESEMDRIAEFFYDVLVRKENPAKVAPEVKEFRQNYQTICYC